jgi:hypothetical protein
MPQFILQSFTFLPLFLTPKKHPHFPFSYQQPQKTNMFFNFSIMLKQKTIMFLNISSMFSNISNMLSFSDISNMFLNISKVFCFYKHTRRENKPVFFFSNPEIEGNRPVLMAFWMKKA